LSIQTFELFIKDKQFSYFLKL